MPKKEGLGEVLHRQIEEMLAGAVQDLQAAGAGVHGVRRRIKRLRSLLRLAEPVLNEAAFNSADQELKRAADCLASTRRAEAMMEAVQKLGQSRSLKAAAALSSLQAAAKMAHNRAAEQLQFEHKTQNAIECIAVVQKMSSSWQLGGHDTKLHLKAVRQDYAKARSKLSKGLAKEDAETLHEARKSLIHNLHHLDFLSPAWPEMTRAWCSELRILRQALGDFNDLHELENLMTQEGSAFASIAEKSQALELVLRRRNRLLKRIDKRRHRVFSEKPGAFARRIAASLQS